MKIKRATRKQLKKWLSAKECLIQGLRHERDDLKKELNLIGPASGDGCSLLEPELLDHALKPGNYSVPKCSF